MKGAFAVVFAIVFLAACTATPAVPSQSPEPQTAASPTLPASPTASPTPFSAPSDAAAPTPLPSDEATPEPEPTPGATLPPGSTPFPTPGPTITPGSTRVIGTLVHADGSPAERVCVVLEKGICPIATDEQGVWFTDIPAGQFAWNFIYRINGQEVGRQSVPNTSGGELRLPTFTIAG